MKKQRVVLESKGFTLVEVIVTIAVLIIASAILATSYTGIMEQQRVQADIEKLEKIDLAVYQILMRDDAFEDIKECIANDSTLELSFVVTKDLDGKTSCVEMQNANIGNKGLLRENCDVFYYYLVEYVGEAIELDSSKHGAGTYNVSVTFNVVELLGKKPVITNDQIIVTNSGNELLHK